MKGCIFFKNETKGENVNKRKGFTLVELLVVIAIIALLMGILMPALARVRRSAQATACMVQVKQWATVFSMYTGDWDGYFFSDYQKMETGGEFKKTLFAEKLQEYYKDFDLLFCPSAKKTRNEGGKVPNSAWSFYCEYDTKNTRSNPTGRSYSGSYTANGWFGAMEKNQPEQYERLAVKRWKNVGLMTQPTQVPLFADVCDDARAFPRAETIPPQVIDTTGIDTDSGGENATNKLQNFCIRRHGPMENPNINVAFGDFSVRATGLKELWSLHWHRNWEQYRQEKQKKVVWPPWMQNYSDKGYIEYE